jgi:WD40 repeat protein
MLWNLLGSKTPEAITNLALRRWDSAVQPVFSPDGRVLAAAAPGRGVRLWETSTGQARAGRDLEGYPVAFSPDGKWVWTRDVAFTRLRKWDVAAQAPLESITIATPKRKIFDSAFSPDGKMIAISQWNRVVLCSAVTGGVLFALDQPVSAQRLAFSPDSQRLATGDDDQTARLWDLKTRQVVWTLTGFRDTVGAVACSANGVFAAASWDGNIKVCDLNAKKEVATLTGHKTGVIRLAFSSDGRTLASGSDDPAVKLWNLETGREILTFKTDVPQYFVHFSPDDKILATGGRDGVVHLWRAPSWPEIAEAEKTAGMVK